MPRTDLIDMEGVTLIFLNFKGEQKKFNPPGQRNFCVLLDPDTAEKMTADGLNVKYLQPREDDDPEAEPQAFLPVDLRYDVGPPPKITLITHGGTKGRLLKEEEVADIDYMDIINVDLTIRARPWGDPEGKHGVKAYLREMYITIEETYFGQKYADLERQ